MIDWLIDQWYDHRVRMITTIATVLLVVGGGTGFAVWHSQQLPEPKITKQQTQIEINKEPSHLYAGTWYSDRTDGAVLHLSKDSTYSSDWLTSGKWEISGSTITLDDRLAGTYQLKMKTIDGETVLYDASGKNYWYSTKKQLKARQASTAASKQAATKLTNQKWQDVLTQGEWKKDADQNADVVSMKITETTITEKYKDGKTKVHPYTINNDRTIADNDAGATVVIALTDSPNMDYHFYLKDTGKQYTVATDITYGSESFHKAYDAVTLTQTGVTKADGENGNTTSTSTDDNGNTTTTKTTTTETSGWN